MNAKRWLAVGGASLLVALVLASLVLWRLEPRLKADIERTLAARLDSQVTLDGLELALWPAPRLAGRGLLQQGKGGDIAAAFGGGSSQTAFGARQGATVLTKATTILGASS